jgi:hypothetical protein
MKTSLKTLLNSIQDNNMKSEILHNLAVILYYEIKTHNKFLDEEIEHNKNIQQYKNNPIFHDESRY